VYAKFRNFPLRINKALGIFRKRVTTRRTTTVVALRDTSWSKKNTNTDVTLNTQEQRRLNAYLIILTKELIQ